jgi:hypothetical protein
MKTFQKVTAVLLSVSFLASPFAALAAEAKKDVKPYPLTTCVVSDEKLGEMGKPYAFTQDGQEIKLCCKSCLKDFKKDTAKYMKKVADAEAKAKK